MSSATDIITYIGVPLAVLGVLPILYTCIKAFYTLSSIKKELVENGIHATTRGSLMSGIVEIELPRFSITPLERSEPEYWELSKTSSSVRGGTWSIFNWEKLATGHTLYRLQYRDELRQPQAEVDFEELIAFLLDRGAIPSADGFRMLRTSGLWTPTGTKLMLSPDSSHSVLRIAPADDSDGSLSLSLQWNSAWDRRDINSLPPYWMRLDQPEENDNESENDLLVSNEAASATQKYIPPSEKKDFRRSADWSSVRFRVGARGVEAAYQERLRLPIDSPLPISHLQHATGSYPNSPGLWFACAATVLGSQKGMGLWNYSIPEEILSFSRKDTVPCGVMVILGAIDEADVPAWFTKTDPLRDAHRHHATFMKRNNAIQAEARMAPADAMAARQRREMEERLEMQQNAMEANRERIERDQRKTIEAVSSPKLDNRVVAEAHLKWLIKAGHAKATSGVKDVVEEVLYRMVFDPAKAQDLSDMLEKWRSWGDSGGMTKDHLVFVQSRQVDFAWAACILCLLRDSSTGVDGSAAADMLSCIRVWSKVRLG